MHKCISLVHPTSNPNSRATALAFAEAGLLHEIITTTAYKPTGALARFIKQLPSSISDRITHELGRRAWVAPKGSNLRSYPWQEILRTVLVKTGLSSSLGLGSQGPVAWVYNSLDRQVARHHLYNLNAIYAYEDVAATTFEAAKTQGILCLYDLPTPFYLMKRDIYAEESKLFPELAPFLETSDEPIWKIKRKEREAELADHIFVASSITKRSLLDIGIPSERISVIPYGAPIEYFQPQRKPDSKFRALFVGRVEPRKGVHYLLRAWQTLTLPDAELLLVGVNGFPAGWLTQHEGTFRHVPSVPHTSLNQYYSSANVLVFPSLAEGFGLVLLEAMACGIPVITTPNTAGPDILTDGVDGFIIPIRNVEALQEKLEWCYRHPQELAEMGKAARRKAEQLTWQLYCHRLAYQVKKLLNVSR